MNINIQCCRPAWPDPTPFRGVDNFTKLGGGGGGDNYNKPSNLVRLLISLSFKYVVTPLKGGGGCRNKNCKLPIIEGNCYNLLSAIKIGRRKVKI